ncbi:alpha-hydroxy-acid oxidizing protein [Acidiferrimicrobium sp. IK]|uniref:alpha-hydroxy acid oxidase n=1 Tax=Acidiferrimicrobium sp. IK TaxID=2871700 RepID=UPI0021CB66D1|nr:alpha-hydroxy acid oxidase [Acidiferrimicrobium sp. IK]MCU4186034.1 alpha-hydroxy-acid oxidizing protein [Acidiferrimicrobium sp. IK]
MGVLQLIEEQRRAALATVPAEVADYVAAGSWAEISAGEAVRAWQRVRLRPRVLRDVADLRTATTIMGSDLAAPILAAPSAYHGLLHPDGEVATAAGVAAGGGLMVLSSRSSASIEAVGDAAGPWWYQVYVLADRSLTEALVRRAAAAGARALVLTGDTPIVGDKSKAPAIPVPPSLRHVNTGRHLAPAVLADDAAALAATTQDAGTGMDAIGWLRDVSGLPVLVKGVLRGDDAAECLAAGASGIIVSNHGGRQLDQAVATADALAEVVDAVDGAAPVVVDGGVHDGLAIVTALALGAAAVMVGRPVQWAVAAGGARGVEALFEALTDDLRRAMALAGAASPEALDRSLIWRPQPQG